MNIVFDSWQQEILDYSGDILVAKGRRIGLTHIMAVKAVEYLYKHKQTHPVSQIICGSITEDQAKVIIAFATMYAMDNYPKFITKGKHKPTQTTLSLTVKGNTRTLIARPCGDTGNSVRAFGAQILMVDEAPFMPPAFWRAAKPALADSSGKLWLWGTHNGTDTYFYKRLMESLALGKDARYKVWVKTTEEVFQNRPISKLWTKERREGNLEFLRKEKLELSEKWYNQEYMALAAVDNMRFFPPSLLDFALTLKRGDYVADECYMGCDVARLGKDSTSLQIATVIDNKVYHVDSFSTKYKLTTEVERLIYKYWQMWKIKKLGVDSGAGSLGVGIYDHLTDRHFYPGLHEQNVLAMNNRKIVIDEDNHTQRFMKEDFYFNLRSMMEHGEIKLLKDDDVRLSLESIQFEHKQEHSDRPRIQGSFDDIADALSLMAWICKKERILKFNISHI